MESSNKIFICCCLILLLRINSVLGTFQLTPRIHGGLQANPGQFSYQVSLRKVWPMPGKTFLSRHYCGGALISDRWVLTSAHCTTGSNANYKDRVIVLGISHNNEVGCWYNFDTVITHPDYSLYHNDIALIKTNQSVEFTDKIRPIRISDRKVLENHEALITGWGIDESRQSPPYLNYLRVKVIGNDLCIKSHMPEYSIYIHNSTICTLGERDTGTCQGDSGGPLVQNRRLIGVISWGVPCTLF